MHFFTGNVGTQAGLLLLSFVLCGIIGLERQYRQKSSGFRTHVLVGMGACTFTLIGAFGFADFNLGQINHDPFRIAAQIVAGIGFLGAGVIFTRRDIVVGLTTAATVWVTAAVGVACGAGMGGLAVLLTALHLFCLIALTPLIEKLPTADRHSLLELTYEDGHGILREIVEIASEQEFATQVLSTSKRTSEEGSAVVDMQMRFTGKNPLDVLMDQLQGVRGIVSLHVAHEDDHGRD